MTTVDRERLFVNVAPLYESIILKKIVSNKKVIRTHQSKLEKLLDISLHLVSI